MLDGLACADAAVVSCLDASVWALPETDLTAAVDAVHLLEQRVAAVKLALVREVDGRGLAVKQGATSTAVWLRERLHVSIQAGQQLVTLAAALDSGPAVIRDALAAGVVTVEQASVIGQAVAALPPQVGAATAAEATSVLVSWAGRLEPTSLRTAGGRIVQHVAPDLAEEADRRALERDAARNQQRRHVTWSIRSDGQLHLKGVLDPEAGAALTAALSPLATPSGLDDTRSPGQRRHDALVDVCRLALRTGELPESGGDAAQVVITTSYDTLTGQLGTGALDTGLRLTPGEVRRLACDAGIVPAVLGGASQVLDLGRLRRLITGPVRRALDLRDGGWAFPGCDRPPRYCQGHHIRHWADGGDTALHNSVLLCGHHHRHIHHTDWQVRLGRDGLPEFIPPAWLDPSQVARRNHYHRRE